MTYSTIFQILTILLTVNVHGGREKNLVNTNNLGKYDYYHLIVSSLF